MPIEYIFCFICSEKFIANISLRKNVGLFSSVFVVGIGIYYTSTALR